MRRFLWGLLVCALLFASCAGAGNNDNYLTKEQAETINSYRSLGAGDDSFYELTYTADYMLPEYMEYITKNKIAGFESRYAMQEVLAPKSPLVPVNRLSNSNSGCSSFMVNDNNGIPVLGRNYDLDNKSNGASIVIHTSPKNGYKSVGMADGAQVGLSKYDLKDKTANRELLLYLPYFTMDGINEKGFACSIMLLYEGRTFQYTGKQLLPYSLVIRYLLDNASSVENAIELLSDKDITPDYLLSNSLESTNASIAFHFAITDSTGDRAVIEYVNGKMIVNRDPVSVKFSDKTGVGDISYPKEKKDYLISTNFILAEGFENTALDGGYWRYQTIQEQLEKNPHPNREGIRGILESVKIFKNDEDFKFILRQEGKNINNASSWNWQTVWSEIFDTKSKNMTLWYKENYDVRYDFGIESNFTGGRTLWNYTPKKYKNFTDLGNYAIEVDCCNVNLDNVIKAINARYLDKVALNASGCTACATLNEKGEVIIGRNMDVTISQYPCIISHTNFGKYPTVNFVYTGTGRQTYKELLESGELDAETLEALPLSATDSFNSEGFFIEANMREVDPYFHNTGTNPGKPKLCTSAIAALVSANCATIEEAVDFVKNSYDFYTMGGGSYMSGWNFAFIIGDATGEYGLLEIANNEVNYIPYQHVQGNFYITPKWTAVEKFGTGYGRFEAALDGLHKVQTEQEMLKHMEKPMWKNELLYIDCAYRDKDGHIHFVDDKGNKVLDWRSDFCHSFLVDENGNIVKESGFEKGYNAYIAGDESFERDYLEHNKYRDRCNAAFVSNDNNFEQLQKAAFEKNKNDGTLEKLKLYYAGDEDPLRSHGGIWTTSFSYGVNCAKKHLLLKLWEKQDVIYEYQW